MTEAGSATNTFFVPDDQLTLASTSQGCTGMGVLPYPYLPVGAILNDIVGRVAIPNPIAKGLEASSGTSKGSRTGTCDC